jgi:hypothetical protein
VWAVECSVAGSVQGQARRESRAFEGEGWTGAVGLKGGDGSEKLMQRTARWLAGKEIHRSYTTSGEREGKESDESFVARCACD